MTRNTRRSAAKRRQQGFALLETLIAIVVLMIGLLAVLATFAMAIGNTGSVQLDSIARQKAAEAMESIYTARQTSQVAFDKIQNVGNGAGIFTPGFTAMTDPGPDGLDGTGDDVPSAMVRLPGPSGVITNTPADVLVDLGNFTPPDSDCERGRQSQRASDYGHRAVPGAAGLDEDAISCRP